MWKTSQGDRILKGAEARLVRETIGFVWDAFRTGLLDESGYYTGVAFFDDLEPKQQLAMILHVGESLLESRETPELTAVREATVYALFRCLFGAIHNEITDEEFDNFPQRRWRQLTLATRRELDLHYDDGEPPELPAPDCNDLDTWEFLTEGLADEILWDRDFEMGYLVEDEDPDNAQVLKQILDIGDDYYTDVSPDPTDDQLLEIHERLDRICNHPR
ncbi:MAG: hypothetical protein AAF497_27520 [Planctomycetota bacterium]